MTSRYRYIHLLLPLLLILGVTQLVSKPLTQVEAESLGSGGVTTRVSVASDGTQANDNSFIPSISADGRFVVFQSSASNLVPGVTGDYTDVFVRDRQTGQTTIVSVSSNGIPGNRNSGAPAISGDGRYVAFHSWSNNLVPGIGGVSRRVYVHDRQTGETTHVSVSPDGTPIGGHYPLISADGRYVGFNYGLHAHIHDRQIGQTAIVSVSSDGTPGNGLSRTQSISANGRYVAFRSDANNLVPDDTNGTWDIFVRDRQTGQTTRVSVASDGTQANDGSSSASISADGRYVAFSSSASNLVPGDTNDRSDVFVRDLQTGQTTRVSVASDGTQGNHGSGPTSISADGRYVSFSSWASNLVPGDTNDTMDVFIHDRQTGNTGLVSVSSEGMLGNGISAFGVRAPISADGRHVAFDSSADNLVPGDTNDSWDVFVHDRGASGAFSISGNIVGVSNNPIVNVTVSTNTGHIATTDTNGNYTVTGLITGTYTLTPSRIGYIFNPASRIVTIPPNATGQDFTGTIQPSSIPVVFLPGIMGSYLWNFPECGDRPAGEIWVNISGVSNPISYNWNLTALHLDAEGQGPAHQCDQIRATAPIDEVGLGQLYHRDFYRRFLDDLQNDYNQTVFEFPYDWRLDMETIALQLDTFIEQEVKPATGAESVVLIGHSLGGLVSRQYTLDQNRAQKVAAVISVGTPYWGAPKAARHMREGTFPIHLLNIATLLDRDSVRAGHRNSPALMQILPSEKYFQQVGPYFRKDGTLLETFAQTDTFFKAHGQNAYLLNQAKIRHVFIDNFVHYLFVPHYILAADHKWVVSGVHERSCWLGTRTCWTNIELLGGDETVPTQSATLRGSGGDLSGNAQVCLYDENWVWRGHSELMAEGVIIHDIGNILAGNTNWCSPNRMMTTSQNEDESVYEITVWGESLVFVEDALGNYSGPSEEGLIINQIPLATYSLSTDSVNLLLPASGAYTITIQQESAEPIQVDIIDFQSFLTSDVFNRYEAALFMNVPSQPDGVATLLLDPTEDLEELRLLLDLDNDGTPDHILPPTSVLDADGLQDMTPPATTITVEGTVDAWGFYTGLVTATIFATDEGTGVLMSEYSMDGGQTWQTYSEPLSFLAEQVPVFEARSVDQAGNQEFPWATKRLRPYDLYLPTIVR